MHASINLALLLLLLVSDVGAQSSSSSSSSAAAEVTMVNTTNFTDICNQDEYTSDCWYPVTCKTCLSRAGCAVEVSTGRCVPSSSSESSSSLLSSTQNFLSGEVTYCSGINPACFTCRRANAPAVCFGSSGCVCVSQCEHISTQPTKCMPGAIDSVGYGSIVAAAAVLFPLVTCIIFKSSSIRRLLQRRRRDKNHRNLPGGLKLDAWRNHLNERAEPGDEQFAHLELRSCFVPMQSDRRPHQPGAGGNGVAETGEYVHVEAGDISRAIAATDLLFSHTAGRDDAAEAREGPTGTELV